MIKQFFIAGCLLVVLCSNSFAQDVFVTENGKRYHTQLCRTIKDKESKMIDKTQAVNEGYTPCHVCFKDEVVVDDESRSRVKDKKNE